MIRDLLLGLRLAVGGGRVSGQALLRLAMTTLGVALVVALLLPAASVITLVDEQQRREAGQTPVLVPRPGVDPLYRLDWFLDAGHDYVQAVVVAPGGPDAPVPPGLDRIPAPGEVVVSPAAAEFLAGTQGVSARARIGGTVVGEIGKPGLATAGDLVVYLGAEEDRLRQAEDTEAVYGFGAEPAAMAPNVTAAALVTPIAVILVLPLLVFVTTASRMGAAQRERRLAALRLLGVGAAQVRRIAAAESLLGALAGLAAGAALFVTLRPLIGELDLFGLRFFPEDFTPPLLAAVAIALLVPGLAVGAAVFGLRRVVVEPLGVVRQGGLRRRRMGWRWAIAALGASLMMTTVFVEERESSDLVGPVLATGSGLLLVSVAVLLPWVVEKLVSRLRGGSPAWQLAIRRLQLDSGTASRVVSGLAVVLAGSVFVQTLLGAIGGDQPGQPGQPGETRFSSPVAAEVVVDAENAAEAQRLLTGTPGITGAHHVVRTWLRPVDDSEGGGAFVEIGDCAALAALAEIGRCADGDVFVVGSEDGMPAWPPSEPMRFVSHAGPEPELGPVWTPRGEGVHVPAQRAAPAVRGVVLVTPGALGRTPMPAGLQVLYVVGQGEPTSVYEAAALAIAPLAWNAALGPGSPDMFESGRLDEATATLRSLLLAASLFVLAVAALSLLLLSIEQIVERRRPLAALAASGVPLSVLARGALWHNAVPMAVGVVLALVAGCGITLPILRYVGLDLWLDAGLLGIVAGAAVLAVLAATALALPLLRQVSRQDGLRSE